MKLLNIYAVMQLRILVALVSNVHFMEI